MSIIGTNAAPVQTLELDDDGQLFLNGFNPAGDLEYVFRLGHVANAPDVPEHLERRRDALEARWLEPPDWTARDDRDEVLATYRRGVGL